MLQIKNSTRTFWKCPPNISFGEVWRCVLLAGVVIKRALPSVALVAAVVINEVSISLSLGVVVELHQGLLGREVRGVDIEKNVDATGTGTACLGCLPSETGDLPATRSARGFARHGVGFFFHLTL